MPNCFRLLAAVASSLFCLTVQAGTAGPPNTVPEPGTWALVGLAAAVGLLVSRNRRK